MQYLPIHDASLYHPMLHLLLDAARGRLAAAGQERGFADVCGCLHAQASSMQYVLEHYIYNNKSTSGTCLCMLERAVLQQTWARREGL